MFLDRNTELAQAVHIMMVQAKISYILIIKVNKFTFFFFLCFLKEIRNGFFVFLSSYRFGRTQKSYGNICLWFINPQHFLFTQTSTCVSMTKIDTWNMFSVSKIMLLKCPLYSLYEPVCNIQRYHFKNIKEN